MYFVAICMDKPDSQELRLANRAAHLDYLRANANTIKTCGPFIADDGVEMIGSLLIIEADSKEAASGIIAREPYNKAGLFQTVELKPWRWVIGAPLK